MDRFERDLKRALRYQPCASCGYSFITGQGERNCQYGDCPYLPVNLDPQCPTCRFNFYTGDGEPSCGEPASCEFAVDEAPRRLALLQRWLEIRYGEEPLTRP